MVDKQEWVFRSESLTVFRLLVYVHPWKLKVQDVAVRRVNCHGAKYAHFQSEPVVQYLLQQCWSNNGISL